MWSSKATHLNKHDAGKAQRSTFPPIILLSLARQDGGLYRPMTTKHH